LAVGHLVPTSTLVAAGLALLVLTVVTVAVRYIDVGEFNLPIALFVAVIKATIVILVFMHLRWDRPFNLLVMIGSVLFVLLMMAFTMMDVSAYTSSFFTGNAPQVQTTLTESAPGAPVALDVEMPPTHGR
jgi:cytochrome c oxidase subunit 4